MPHTSKREIRENITEIFSRKIRNRVDRWAWNHSIYHSAWLRNVRSLTLSTLTFLNAFWRSFQFCINSCSSFAWNFTFFNGIQSETKSHTCVHMNCKNWNQPLIPMISMRVIWATYLNQLNFKTENINDWQSFVLLPPMRLGKTKRC